MSNKPYFVIPYDSISYIKNVNGTIFSRECSTKPETAFDKDPMADNIDFRVEICSTLDVYNCPWSYKGIKAVHAFLAEKVTEDAPEDLKLMILKFKWLIQKIDHVRTMHVSKKWELAKTDIHGQ